MWVKDIFTKKKREKSNTVAWRVLLIGGILGLIASVVLTIEKIHLLENPGVALSCDFNPLFNCSTVMQTWQASVFGFPNMILGLIGYSVVLTIAVAALGGVKYPRWFLLLGNLGALLAAIFAYWLLFQSVYVIEVLCPWCLVVTFSMTLIIAAFTHYNLKNNTFNLKGKLQKGIDTFIGKGYHQLVVASWIVLVIALVYIKFGL